MDISQLRRLLKEKSKQETAYLYSVNKELFLRPSQINFQGSRGLEITYANALLELVDMAKDARDTFRPYKTRRHVWRDIMQLLNGIESLFYVAIVALPTAIIYAFFGISGLVLTPIIFFLPQSEREKAPALIVGLFYLSGAAFVKAVTASVRGITQIITAPLTWARVGMRLLMFRNTPWETLTEKIKFKDYLKRLASLVFRNEDNLETVSRDSQDFYDALKDVYRKDKDHHSTVRQALWGQVDKPKDEGVLFLSDIVEETQYHISPLHFAALSTRAKVLAYLHKHMSARVVEIDALTSDIIYDYLNDYGYQCPDSPEKKQALIKLNQLCKKYDYQNASDVFFKSAQHNAEKNNALTDLSEFCDPNDKEALEKAKVTLGIH